MQNTKSNKINKKIIKKSLSLINENSLHDVFFAYSLVSQKDSWENFAKKDQRYINGIKMAREEAEKDDQNIENGIDGAYVSNSNMNYFMDGHIEKNEDVDNCEKIQRKIELIAERITRSIIESKKHE